MPESSRVEGATLAVAIVWKQPSQRIADMRQLVYFSLFTTSYSANTPFSIAVFAWLRRVSGAAVSGLASATNVLLVCSSLHAYR